MTRCVDCVGLFVHVGCSSNKGICSSKAPSCGKSHVCNISKLPIDNLSLQSTLLHNVSGKPFFSPLSYCSANIGCGMIR